MEETGTHVQPRPADTGGRRVAVVHDWLTGMRGGEKALEALLELLPDAQLFTLLHDRGSVSKPIEALQPRRSFIQYLPFAQRHYRQYLPLFPTAIEQFDLDHFDLIVSTSHCAAKAVVRTGRARHLCYCFTPMRYAWDQFDAYFGPERVGNFKSYLYRLALHRLARWDASTAGRVNNYVAISLHVARRILRYYNREAQVVYPPVDTRFFTPSDPSPGHYFVVVSALVPYKRVDLAIQACEKARVPLRIVGKGPDATRLRAQAGPNVEFVGNCSDRELRELYRESMGLLLTGEEDFGIAPVEAQACGRPVIALARGGALETVTNGVTGLLVADATASAFAEAIENVKHSVFDPRTLAVAASRFSRRRFQDEMRLAIENLSYKNYYESSGQNISLAQ